MTSHWSAALELLELVDYAALAKPPPLATVVAPEPRGARARPADASSSDRSASASPALKLVEAPAALEPPPARADAIDPGARLRQVVAAIAEPAAETVRGTLTFYQAGALLVVDDSDPQHAAASETLLRKILAAARRPPLSEPPQAIHWPLPGVPEGTLSNARDYTEAYLSSRRARAPFDDIWLMGKLPLACVGPPGMALTEALGSTLSAIGGSAVRVLPSLHAMSVDPRAKASCWHALKRFYGLK